MLVPSLDERVSRVVDQGTVRRAEAVLKYVAKPELPPALDCSAICALTFFNDTGFDNACFMTVMTSRLVFGDDRLGQMMEQDLLQG